MENSRREQILAHMQRLLSGVASFKTVKRLHPAFKDLRTYAETQLPFCGVFGKLPQPEYHIGGRRAGMIVSVEFQLAIDLLVYARDHTEPDTRISDLADDIWRALHTDITLGGLATGLKVSPDIDVGVQHPHIAFFMTVTVKYLNTELTL